jgi:hypothetical protein
MTAWEGLGGLGEIIVTLPDNFLIFIKRDLRTSGLTVDV